MVATIFKFLARLFVAYVIIFFGTLLIWEVLGVVDREGGKAMALAFFIAPILSTLAALVWPNVCAMLVRNKTD